MYTAHFGLTHDPFAIAPDPRYLFMSARHREALAHLLFGVAGDGAGGGFVLLTGEIGAGKTTLCRALLQQIPQGCRVAYVFNPKLSALELVASVCQEFGIAVAAHFGERPGFKDFLDTLNAFLLERHAAGERCVLIIDEAQSLSADVLEQLRLLTNLETSERKLLQIVLIGQPELREMLARPELEQLAQRVVARFHLDVLTPDETAQYVAHRLAVAGLKGAMPFDARALRELHRLARGVPRRINLLAGRALLAAYAQAQARADGAMVRQAAREVFGLDERTVGRAGRRMPGWSAILQALQRAQAQRHAGQPVDLHLQTLVPAAGSLVAPPVSTSWWNLAWLALVVLLGGLAVFVWSPWSVREAVPQTQSPATAASNTAAQVAAPSSAIVALVAPAASAALAPPSKSVSAVATVASAPPAVATRIAPSQVAAPQPKKASAPKPALSAASAAFAAAPDPARKLPTRAELPPELRELLPPLAVNGVVYADDPAQRMLVLDGQVLQPGGQIAPGVRLEFIGPRTSVLSVQGTPFVLSH